MPMIYYFPILSVASVINLCGVNVTSGCVNLWPASIVGSFPNETYQLCESGAVSQVSLWYLPKWAYRYACEV